MIASQSYQKEQEIRKKTFKKWILHSSDVEFLDNDLFNNIMYKHINFYIKVFFFINDIINKFKYKPSFSLS